MADGYTIEQDVTKAVADFEKGGPIHITKGVEECVDAAHHLPAALRGCTHMFGDIAAIAKWTAIVAHPEELKKKIEKNTALHIRKIKADITALETDM